MVDGIMMVILMATMIMVIILVIKIKIFCSSRFSNLLTVLAYIDICYVTIELVHISIKIWASVIKITAKILEDPFNPG